METFIIIIYIKYFNYSKFIHKIFFIIIISIFLFSSNSFFFNVNFSLNLSTSVDNVSELSPQPNILTKNSTDRFTFSQTISLRDSVGVSPLLAQGFNGTGIKIGIVDTGVYANHSQFGNRIINQKSFVSTIYGYSSNISSTSDTIGHGTMIAGLAIGTTTGMAPAAELVSAKIYNAGVTGNAGYPGEETSSAVAAAIEWLASQNVSVISLSLGQYQDIYREGRAWIIDKFTMENGIIFTVAAGNEGIVGINTGSIGNPAESLQAITVGMSSGTTAIDTRTSYGPRFDWVMKPDLVAPGDNLYAPSYTGPNGYTFCIGTSCATPVVAGSIADILSALKAYNLTYTPGTIKAALLATAAPIVQDSSTGASYPWWMEGAGLINASKALQYILSSSRTNGTLPDLLTAYPSHLPFTPINTLFQGQQLGFNVTLVSSGSSSIVVSLENFSSTFFSISTQLIINNTGFLPVWFHIPLNACDGSYNGTIIITTNRNALKVYINIHFELRTPKGSILFDETHNGFYNQVVNLADNINNIQDPWGKSTFLLGSYFSFFLQMTANDISVSTFRSGSLNNLSYLQQFDTLMLVYPETKLTDPFSDWWNNPMYFPDSNLSNNVISFTSQELQTISDFVYKLNHNVLIFTAYPNMENITALNPLLNLFNVSYSNTLIKQTINSIDFPSPFNTDVSSIDFIGSSLIANTSTFRGDLFGKFTNTTSAFAYWKSNTGGKVFISGSGYFIDNFGLSTLITYNAKNNSNFMMNIMNFFADNSSFSVYAIDCSSSSSNTLQISTYLTDIVLLSIPVGTLVITLVTFVIVRKHSRIDKKSK